MLSWSLTYSPILATNTKTASRLRKKLLLTPINPKQAIRLNYQTLTEKIYSALTLAEIKVSIKDVRRLLARPDSSSLSRQITNYHTALDFIRLDWTNNPDPITNKTLFSLHKIITRNLKNTSGLREKNLTIKDGADGQSFTTPSPDEIPFQLDSLMNEVNQPDRQHPIITAGIAHIQILRILPFSEFNQLTALLFSELVLAKENYTYHYLINTESIFVKDPQAYIEAARNTLKQQANLNNWLIYFTQSFTTAQDHALARLQSAAHTKPKDNLGLARLNDRQRAILRYLDKPERTITNNQVVDRFKVSQITASRDLSKLKKLGLVSQIGRGRSTTYTKI